MRCVLRAAYDRRSTLTEYLNIEYYKRNTLCKKQSVSFKRIPPQKLRRLTDLDICEKLQRKETTCDIISTLINNYQQSSR